MELIRLQRNLLFILSAILLASNLYMAVLLHKKDRAVVLLPTVDREIVIGTQFVSDEYLLLRADQITQLLFNIREQTYNYNITQLMSQVSSKQAHEFKAQLENFANDVKQKHYYYVFNKQAYEVNNANLSVTFSGHLDTYLNDKKIASNFKSYKISFINSSGLVTLTSFEEV